MNKGPARVPKDRRTEPTRSQGRRRQAVVSLEGFARNSGVGRAISAYRQRKQRHRQHTAVALRQYRKVVHQAGYEAGQGASRKRARGDDDKLLTTREDDEEDSQDGQKTDANATQSTVAHVQRTKNSTNKDKDEIDPTQQQHQHHNDQPPARRQRRHKTNRYKDLVPKQQQPQQERDHSQPVDPEQERRQRLVARRQRTQRLRQKTARGQPVMKNLVHNILEKLQKEDA